MPRLRQHLFSRELRVSVNPEIIRDGTMLLFPELLLPNPVTPMERAILEVDEFFYRFAGGSSNLKKFMLKLFAYFCTPEAWIKKFWVYYGPKANNGKTTFMKILAMLLGSFYTRIGVSTLTAGKMGKGAHSTDIVDLQGKYLGCCNEFDSDGKKLDIELIKSITGRDGLVGRRAYSDKTINFETNLKVVILTNSLPEMKLDNGVLNRICIVPCNGHFVENPDPENPNEYLADPNFDHKLKTPEFRSACLSAVYYGMTLLRKEGYVEPEEIKLSIDNYIQEMDYIKDFIDECIERVPVERKVMVKLSDVTTLFGEWVRHYKYDQDCAGYFKKGALTKALAEKGFAITQSNGYKYKNIQLKRSWQDVIDI